MLQGCFGRALQRLHFFTTFKPRGGGSLRHLRGGEFLASGMHRTTGSFRVRFFGRVWFFITAQCPPRIMSIEVVHPFLRVRRAAGTRCRPAPRILHREFACVQCQEVCRANYPDDARIVMKFELINVAQ